MLLNEITDYKNALRLKLQELKKLKSRERFTLKSVADHAGIQYTYLSKVLNNKDFHLSDDHLFEISEFLGFLPQEIEVLSLLKNLKTTASEKRRTNIQKKLDAIKKEGLLKAQVQADSHFNQTKYETQYLFDPHCLLVHEALQIERYRRSPMLLCPVLNLSRARLKEILILLAKLKFIDLDFELFKVRGLLKGEIHYSTSHPLTRVHQTLMKTASTSKLIELSESDKKSFMVTFAADDPAFESVKVRFAVFIKEVEAIVAKSKKEDVYQLNFDLFKWFEQ